jgi:peptide/nickel transport system substrate-binding protein
MPIRRLPEVWPLRLSASGGLTDERTSPTLPDGLSPVRAWMFAAVDMGVVLNRSFILWRGFVGALLLFTLLVGPAGQSLAAHQNAKPAPKPVRGGTLVEGLLVDPDQLLPNFSGQLYAQLVQQTLFAPLFYSDNKGNIQPGLATVVPTVKNGGISADGRTYTFHMRKGLRWSDGTPLTARDIDFSWRLWTNPKLNLTPYSTLGIDRIGATTISADGLGITFTLVQPWAPFLADWTDALQPLPAHTMSLLNPATLANSGFALVPNVNSGPFTLQEVRHGDRIIVARNSFYYQKAQGYPYLDSIVFRTVSGQNAMLSALRSHVIDTAWLLPITSLATLQHMPGVNAVPAPSANWEAAVINRRRPILQDVRVRQALAYGLNRGAEVKQGWHGFATLIGSDQPPSSSVYTSKVGPYPYDPGRAGQLLDAAGWKLGSDGFRRKGGKILSLTYSTTFNNPWRQLDESQALSDYEALGIQLIIRNYPAGYFAQTVLPSGDFDLAEYVFSNNLDPDDTATFGSRFTPPAGSNFGAYSNVTFDQLAGQEVTTVDPANRAALFQRAEQLLHDDVAALWLYSPDNLGAANTRVNNYLPAPFSGDTWNAWAWWVTPPKGAAKH